MSLSFMACILKMAVDTAVSLATGRRRVAVIDADGYSLQWADKDWDELHYGKPERWPYVPAWPYDNASVDDLRAAGFWVVYAVGGKKLPPTWGVFR